MTGRGAFVRSRRPVAITLAAVTAVVAVAAFAGLRLARTRADQERFRPVVLAYNQALIKSLATTDERHMSALVGPGEMIRLGNYVGKIKGEARYQYARLDELAILDVLPISTQATVTTREVWAYQYFDGRTRKPASPPFRQRLELVYTLAFRQGRWEVEIVDVLKQEDIAER